MARQEAQSKLLYYPTPLEMVQVIGTWLKVGDGLMRYADPCVGEGEALRALVDQVGGATKETWGVELSYSRAEKAANVIDAVLPTSFYAVSWEDDTVSIVLDNPPYDWSEWRDDNGKRMRHEVLFAQRVTPKLVAGGVHILIVPQMILRDETLARHWSGWYEKSLCFRFPDGLFEAFSQVILIGVKRRKYQYPTRQQIELFKMCGYEGETDLSPIENGDGRFQLPPSPKTARFVYHAIGEAERVLVAAKANVLGTPDWAKQTYIRPVGAPINPLTQLKIGHLSMLISAGELGIVTLKGKKGQMLVKGTLVKRIEKTTEPIYDKDGEVTGQKVEETEKMASVITLTHANGTLESISGSDAVAKFITENVNELADAVLERNKPFYNWQPTKDEWTRVSRCALNLKPLPGRDERGLFDVQKHFAIASSRKMMKDHHIILNCEMGFGKTSSATATLELLAKYNRFPVLVMCPGHMLDKWRREVEEVSDPDDPIRARIITRPARAEKSWLAEHILPILRSYNAELLRDERWQVSPVSANDNGMRRRLTVVIASDKRHHAIERMAKQMMVKCVGEGETLRACFQNTLDGFTIECVDRDDYTLFDFFTDYDGDKLGCKAVAIIGFEAAKYDAGIREIEFRYRWVPMINEESGKGVVVHAPCCPQCGKPLGAKIEKETGRFITSQMLSRVGDKKSKRYTMMGFSPPDVCPHVERVLVRDEKGKVMMMNDKPLMAERKCGARLYEMSRWRRTGVGRLVQRKFAHRFKVYIADEVHKAKSGDTDISGADGRLLSSVRDSIALTGTLFGGAASSLFYLLFRRSGDVRQHYDFKDVNRWIDHFGLWKYRYLDNGNLKVERGKSSGVERWNVRPPQEMPGVSPAVVRFLLPITLFGKITDLGYVLPPLHDEVRLVDMGKELKEHYVNTGEFLLEQAMERLEEEHDPGLLSVWFATCRFRPMSAWRDESASYKGEVILPLPAVCGKNKHLPKEKELAKIINEKCAQGRKTLVFVEQTGTRDIRKHLEEVLVKLCPGVNVQMLSSNSMKPAKRESWIRRQSPSMDVLLVNAKLIETGIDLVMFSDIVFYETNTSLYVIWQAMRRVWRLGQSKPVSTIFLAHRDTVEASLLEMMGHKMKSAMLLYGDHAAGALIESDDDDLSREMMRRALEGKTIASAGDLNGKSLFGADDQKPVVVTQSPLGSSTATSVLMPIVTTVIPVDGLVQASLFDF